MATISPSELDARIESNQRDVFILDIRPRDEFEEWHIPGSENIDIYDDLKEGTEAASAALSELPDAPEIVTVCAAGVVSQKATKQLRDLGYERKRLKTECAAGVVSIVLGQSIPKFLEHSSRWLAQGRGVFRTFSFRTAKRQSSTRRSTVTNTRTF